MAEKQSSNAVGKQKTSSERSSEVKTTEKASSKGKKSTGESEVLEALQFIRSEMIKQTNKMSEQDKMLCEQANKLTEFSSRLDNMEHGYYEGDEYEYEDTQSQNMDTAGVSGQEESSSKRKRDEVSDEGNRFSSMSKKYKIAEKCDVPIDSVLAENVTELFRYGIDKQKYEELIKDDKHARPENCEGLVVVRTDEMIWKSLSPFSRTTDDKLQDIEEPVVKAAVVLAKVVNKMANMEADMQNPLFGELIEDCNDSLALLGHANTLLNMTRKDFLKPELNQEYKHLCSHNRPFTKTLFGDDLPKSAKELEDCSKISYKMFTGRHMRGSIRSRPMGRGIRYRGTGRGQRGRGAPAGYGPGTGNRGAKNLQGRGMPRHYKY